MMLQVCRVCRPAAAGSKDHITQTVLAPILAQRGVVTNTFMTMLYCELEHMQQLVHFSQCCKPLNYTQEFRNAACLPIEKSTPDNNLGHS